MSELDGLGWVVVPPEAIPRRWRNRSVTVSLVPLLPGEVAGVLREGETAPQLEPGDEALLSLIASGTTVASAARRLGVPLRTVQRRLAHWRAHFGAGTTHELGLMLAARGFRGVAGDAPPDDAGERADSIESRGRGE